MRKINPTHYLEAKTAPVASARARARVRARVRVRARALRPVEASLAVVPLPLEVLGLVAAAVASDRATLAVVSAAQVVGSEAQVVGYLVTRPAEALVPEQADLAQAVADLEQQQGVPLVALVVEQEPPSTNLFLHPMVQPALHSVLSPRRTTAPM